MDQIEQLQEQLHKQEKLASLGLLSAGRDPEPAELRYQLQ